MLRSSALVLLLVVGGALTGCGGEDLGPDAASDWPSATATVDASGLVYAIGDTVHLADGSTIAVGEEIETFVLGGGGVFFTTGKQHGPSYGGYLRSAPLYYSRGSGKPRKVAEAAATPRTSPDGRYLAFLDLTSGKKDQFGTPQAEAVVVDLEKGREVARTTEDLGDPDSDDDLDVVYGEALLGVLAVTDTTVYYEGVGDVVAIDLTTGKAAMSDESDDEFALPPDDDRLSPDGGWKIVDVERDHEPHDQLAPVDGDAVRLSGVPSKVDLLWWVDDDTAAGYAIDGGADAHGFTEGTSVSLVTCVVPSGRCTAVPGTSGVTLHVPEGTLDGTTFDLPDGR